MPRAFQLVGDGTGDGLRSVISTVSFLVQTSLLPCPGPLGTPPGEMIQQTVLLVCSVSLSLLYRQDLGFVRDSEHARCPCRLQRSRDSL